MHTHHHGANGRRGPSTCRVSHAVVRFTLWLGAVHAFGNNDMHKSNAYDSVLHGMVNKSGMLDVREWHADYDAERLRAYNEWATAQGVNLSLPVLAENGNHAFPLNMAPSQCLIYVNDR